MWCSCTVEICFAFIKNDQNLIISAMKTLERHCYQHSNDHCQIVRLLKSLDRHSNDVKKNVGIFRSLTIVGQSLVNATSNCLIGGMLSNDFSN